MDETLRGLQQVMAAHRKTMAGTGAAGPDLPARRRTRPTRRRDDEVGWRATSNGSPGIEITDSLLGEAREGSGIACLPASLQPGPDD